MGRSPDRDERVDRLLSGAFDRPLGGRWLVAGALPNTEAALAEAGAEPVSWHRFARGEVAGLVCPEGDAYAGAVMRLPRGSRAIDLALHLVAARLAPDGELWVGGANDEGIRGVDRRMAEVLEEPLDPVPGGHGRRLGGRRPKPGLRGSLDDWAERVEVELDGRRVELTSWPGLFAHGHLDPGTALLLDHLPEVRGAAVLDFACGVGVVARALVDRGAGPVTASDHDALAVHAAARNVPTADLRCVDGLPRGSWDLIVSNPPIHRGNDRDWSVLEGLARELARALRPGGSVRLVTQETVPVRRLFPGATVARVASAGGYAVWSVGR